MLRQACYGARQIINVYRCLAYSFYIGHMHTNPLFVLCIYMHSVLPHTENLTTYHFSLWPSLNKIMRSCHEDMNTVIKIIMASCWGSSGECWDLSELRSTSPLYTGVTTALCQLLVTMEKGAQCCQIFQFLKKSPEVWNFMRSCPFCNL